MYVCIAFGAYSSFAQENAISGNVQIVATGENLSLDVNEMLIFKVHVPMHSKELNKIKSSP